MGSGRRAARSVAGLAGRRSRRSLAVARRRRRCARRSTQAGVADVAARHLAADHRSSVARDAASPPRWLVLFAGWVVALWPYYHVFGTDQTGNDVLFQAIKSIRTAVVIGSLATIATLPFAIVFGILAGYYKGRVDDAIQYLYTVLSSIPSVLLIAAFVLMIQVFIDKNPQMFDTGLRARRHPPVPAGRDPRASPAGPALARLLRAETLKLGELDYVQAARAFGVSDAGIMRRHILPNVTHVVLIVAVLDFSGLVLYEAVLSYVGVGVDPTTNSFGTMINSARNEMSRDPVVWWTLLAAFAFMVTLVLSMTALRERRARSLRPARPRLPRPARASPRPAHRRFRPSSSSGRGSRLGYTHARDRKPHDRNRFGQRPRPRSRRADAHHRARRDLRAGRRVGLRQVDDGAVDPAPACRTAAASAAGSVERRWHRHHAIAGERRCATSAAAASASSSRSRRPASIR